MNEKQFWDFVHWVAENSKSEEEAKERLRGAGCPIVKVISRKLRRGFDVFAMGPQFNVWTK
jgi:hypothetical protein